MARTMQTPRNEMRRQVVSGRHTAPADRIDGSAPDVFGPNHPVFQLVSSVTQLPDDITRLVVQYASHLYPRQARYSGNVMIQYCTCVTYKSHVAESTEASTSSSSVPVLTLPSPLSFTSSFSLHNRSLSMCGWMSRAVGGLQQYLMSVHSTDVDQFNMDNSHVHIGYTCHPNAQPVNCFTVAFGANDLVVVQPTIDVASHHEWEHCCTTLHYPRSAHCGPPMTAQTSASSNSQSPAQESTAAQLARRRLYRNGVLVAEDDCLPPITDDRHVLLLGQYSPCSTFSSLHGGLCDVRLYSRALDQDEVTALYSGKQDTNSSVEALEVWYKLDASGFDERVVRDSSGHGRHATVTGAALQLSMTGGCDPVLAPNESTGNPMPGYK